MLNCLNNTMKRSHKQVSVLLIMALPLARQVLLLIAHFYQEFTASDKYYLSRT